MSNRSPLSRGYGDDLETPDPARDLGDDTYVAPRTPTERQLTEIFEELLGGSRVGVHDTFFDLNGFSLLATQVAVRIYEIFRVELTLKDVFESPTVEGLARLVLMEQARDQG